MRPGTVWAQMGTISSTAVSLCDSTYRPRSVGSPRFDVKSTRVPVVEAFWAVLPDSDA